MVEVRKRERENISSLLRRFQERLKKSGILIQAKQAQYFHRPKSKREMREAAKMRIKLREEREKLKKLGKLESF